MPPARPSRNLRGHSTLEVLAAGASAPLPEAPIARIEPVSETFFGETVVDPYRWMENPKDQDWGPFLQGQNAHARAVLDAIPCRHQLKQRIAELSGGTALVFAVQSVGERVFYQVRPTGADNTKLAVRDGLAGAERVLIDPAAMKRDDGQHTSLDWWWASPDGTHVVYGLSLAGSENSVLHVMEVESMRVLPERIPGTQYAGPSWLPDGSGFFYFRVADPANLGSVDYYRKGLALLHKLGTDPGDDAVLMTYGKDPAVPVADNEFPFIFAGSGGGEWVMLLIRGGVRRENPCYVARLADVLAGRGRWKRVCSVDDQVVEFDFDADDLYLLTTKDAPNGKVLRTKLANASFQNAITVVAEGPLVLEGISLARDGLYLRDLDGGYHSVRKLARDGTIAAVPLPWEGSVAGPWTSPAEDGCWLSGSGWLLPLTIFRHDPASGRTEPAGLVPPTEVDLSEYEAVRSFVTARDGTRVPLSIIAKKGLTRDGRNPALVIAYGAYQSSISPGLSLRRLALLERGAVFCVAHVRGGGEYGRRWWKGGQKSTKPNSWRDLIDCCEQLIEDGWTSGAMLTIQGGSAGGITVGRAMTERPELFAGVISNVGISNALRAEFSQNGPPNIDEFGTVSDKDGFVGLKQMDALHHVRDGAHYPAVLLTAGVTDPRVEAWHGAKLAARLQQATRSGRPVLLRVNFDAGHGLGSTRSQLDDECADEFAFVLSRDARASVA